MHSFFLSQVSDVNPTSKNIDFENDKLAKLIDEVEFYHILSKVVTLALKSEL